MNLNSSLQKTPIAVIGLSSIFADARNVEEFWTNIIQSKDSIIDVPANRWLIEDYYDEDMFAPDKTYCKRGGFLPEIDFNPIEFGLPPNILQVTDASQLLGLVAARDAFEDAGYGQKAVKFTKELKEKTGVLLGVGGGQKLITPLIARLQYPIWERALRASGVSENDIPHIVDKMKKAYVSWNENAFPGLLGNVISGRITNRFDLGGINSVVDAACAASLSAVKMALSELVEGRADMMLTGGVDTDNSPFMYMSFSKTPAFSKSGNIRPFSDDADGMLIGEGIGMLVLKRLSDAERDGDQIYATITGVGTSSDGRFKSVYAPRPAGQALAMNRAYEDAGYAPSTVGLLEGHGTGTGAGDPTEFTSMQMVFGANNPKKQHIALGSVKSQIGHTKSAAGAAGIIKMVLALHHKVLPPTINVKKPNQKFDIENSAMYINTETRPWMRNGHPRRAGVSAFGFGGINVHITLEEYIGQKNRAYRMHEPYKSVVLQGESITLLQQSCQNLIAELKNENADLAFENVVRNSKSQVLNPNLPRLGFVVSNIAECIDFLNISIQNLNTSSSEWMHPKGVFFRNQSIDINNNKVVALFAGQGAQYVGMGKELANAFPEIADTFAQADELFVQNGEKALSSGIFPIPVFTNEEREIQHKELTQTQIAQPAIGTLCIGQYKVLQKAGFEPHFAAGHSFGELTALWAAGSYDDATFLTLAKSRGAAMALQNGTTDAGSMLAVKATLEQVQQAITHMAGVQIANVNSNNQIILGGSTSAIQSAETQLKNQGFSVVLLPVAAAFHTPFVAHAQQPFAAFLAKQTFVSPKIPVFANSTGQAYPADVASLKTILENQILNPVLFKNQIENIHAAGGRIFIEFGPKGILTSLVKNILENKEFTAIALNANAQKDSDLQLRQAVVQMRVLGLSLKDIDPYKKQMEPLPPKSKLTVKLSGNNYVAEDTKKTYNDVMTDGFKIKGASTQIIEKVVEKIIKVDKIVEKIVEVPSKNGLHITDNTMQKETILLLQETLNAFKTNQSKSLEIFEGFMTEQNRQGQQIIKLLEDQLADKSANEVEPIALTATVKGVPFYPNTPAETLDRTPLFTNGVSSGKTQTVPTVAPIAAVSNGTTQTHSNLTAQLLAVVSEKTGYPAEMLELGMDMEADLGIDSIKRVEIFGALTQQNPEMSSINPNELTELRTLQEIVDYVSAHNANGNSILIKPASTPSSNGKTQTVPTVAPIAAVSNGTTQTHSNLTAQLLAVVSEKTGYPAEMLELGMDMEADLGIDSIKRVEIFGALTQQNPEMSSINPNELTELRTLQEIVNYVSAHNTNGNAILIKTASAPSSNGKTQTVPTVAPIASISNGTTQTHSNLTAQLLAVVSEKTGYPAEMLELGMDMEADLGIDSIKRVEIFGALTQQNPEMSSINPNELTELRTLQEIVDYVDFDKKKGSTVSSEIEVVQKKTSVSSKGMVKTGAFHKVTRFEIGLEYLPQPDFLEFSLPETHHVLVTNEGTELTQKVISALQMNGMSVLVLNLPNVKNPITSHAINLTAATDEAMGQAIETLHTKYGKIGSFIHLHPHFEFEPGHFTQHFSVERAIVKTLFFLAKHIQKDLNELGKTQRANFLTFTRLDGQLGQGQRGNTSIVGGGIPGLVKCLNLEWSPVFCRAVDIQPELSIDFIANQVISELHDANTRIVEVAVSEQGRKTTIVRPADAPEFQEIQTSVTADSVFFVSGGARGVTATCVVEMAKTFQNKFILLGRSSSTFEVPAFAKNENDEGTLKRLIMNDLKEKGEKPSLAVVKSMYNEIVAKKEIDETLAQIARHGGKAVYIKGDITNLGTFKQELLQATTQMGKITGIIHGAGRLADKYIQDKTEADFENVISVKLDGLLALLGSVNLNQLDHLILFSSVAGFYGNVGQTDYAIANEILSRAAHLFRTNHPKTKVSAINWGAWDSGMVSGELKTQFEVAGISLVNSEGGAAMLVNELNTAYANQPQVIIGGTLPAAVSFIGDLRSYRIRRKLSLEQNPYLTHHVIQGNAVLPVVNAVGWMAQSCELLYPDFAVFKIEDTKLFKGLVFDKKIKSDYILEIKEIKKSEGKIDFETTILSEGGKLPTFHYKSTVTIINKKSIPTAQKFTHKVSGNYTPTDGAILYKDDTLFHGPYFQGIQQVLDCNAEQIVLSCKAPEVPVSVQGQFAVQSINTFFADIQYQGILVWVAKNKDGAKSLPLQTDDAIMYKQVPFGKELFVHIGIQSHSETQMAANCTVYDADGTVYIETHGASVTVSQGLTW